LAAAKPQTFSLPGRNRRFYFAAPKFFLPDSGGGAFESKSPVREKTALDERGCPGGKCGFAPAAF
jgi:hypothetical protein